MKISDVVIVVASLVVLLVMTIEGVISIDDWIRRRRRVKAIAFLGVYLGLLAITIVLAITTIFP